MLAERLRKGDNLIGTMIRVSRNPIIVNIAKNSGFDFIMVDMELGSYSFEQLSDFLMAAKSLELGALVRVPELTRSYVARALDLGANGVMVPMIETVEQAHAFVEWSKYSPVGNRGMSANCGHTGYRKETDVRAMMDRLNNQTLTIAQIESGKGIQLAEEIANVEGIDVLLVGPNDLSVSMGCPGNLDSAQMQEAILKVAQACQKNKKIFGMHGNGSLLEKWIPYDLSLIMSSTDFDIMNNGMKNLNENCRKLVSKS